jgi:hypothetical protein
MLSRPSSMPGACAWPCASRFSGRQHSDRIHPVGAWGRPPSTRISSRLLLPAVRYGLFLNLCRAERGISNRSPIHLGLRGER